MGTPGSVIMHDIHIQIPLDWLYRSHIIQYHCGYTGNYKSRILLGFSTAIACAVASQPFVTVASEYPHSTLTVTATCSSHSGTA